MNWDAAKVATYLKRYKKANYNFSLLYRLKGFKDAWEDPIAQLLIFDEVQEHKELVARLLDLTATDEDRMRYKVVNTRLARLVNRINTYKKTLQEVDEHISAA